MSEHTCEQPRRLFNIPEDDLNWVNIRDGSLTVKLLVFPEPGVPASIWGIRETLKNCPVGDDQSPYPEAPYIDEALPLEEVARRINKDQRRREAWIHKHYHLTSENGKDLLVSPPHLAVILLGGTTWTGYCRERDVYWSCAFENLSEKGKLLYRATQDAFSGAKLHLRTFLDQAQGLSLESPISRERIARNSND